MVLSISEEENNKIVEEIRFRIYDIFSSDENMKLRSKFEYQLYSDIGEILDESRKLSDYFVFTEEITTIIYFSPIVFGQEWIKWQDELSSNEEKLHLLKQELKEKQDLHKKEKSEEILNDSLKMNLYDKKIFKDIVGDLELIQMECRLNPLPEKMDSDRKRNLKTHIQSCFRNSI